MNYQEFCYWLQGFFEIAQPETITPQQLQIIQDHLHLVLGVDPVSEWEQINYDKIPAFNPLVNEWQTTKPLSPELQKYCGTAMSYSSPFVTSGLTGTVEMSPTITIVGNKNDFFNHSQNNKMTLFDKNISPSNITNTNPPIVVSC